jgi:transposase
LDTVAVESIFNWYWLVDGLRDRGYNVVLANPAAIDQYSGIKHADDANDAYFLADLLRLDILPTGHIYDPVIRPTRDLLRRRLQLVRQRTVLMLSLKSLYARITGKTLSLSLLNELSAEEVPTLIKGAGNQLIAQEQVRLIGRFKSSIIEPREGCYVES